MNNTNKNKRQKDHHESGTGIGKELKKRWCRKRKLGKRR